MERLEGDLGGERGGAHHFKEGGLRLEGAIFGEVTAGLAHDPERGALEGGAGKGGEETFAGSHGGSGELSGEGGASERVAQSRGCRKRSWRRASAVPGAGR